MCKYIFFQLQHWQRFSLFKPLKTYCQLILEIYVCNPSYRSWGRRITSTRPTWAPVHRVGSAKWLDHPIGRKKAKSSARTQKWMVPSRSVHSQLVLLCSPQSQSCHSLSKQHNSGQNTHVHDYVGDIFCCLIWFWVRVPCHPGGPSTCYVTMGDHELLSPACESRGTAWHHTLLVCGDISLSNNSSSMCRSMKCSQEV